MIAKRDYELIKAIKNHKCCGKSDSSQGGGESSTQSQSFLMSLIPSSLPKPAKFFAGSPDNLVDVTDYTIDELIVDENDGAIFRAVYDSNSLASPVVQGVELTITSETLNFSVIMPSGNISTLDIPFEGKTYYFYNKAQIG